MTEEDKKSLTDMLNPKTIAIWSLGLLVSTGVFICVLWWVVPHGEPDMRAERAPVDRDQYVAERDEVADAIAEDAQRGSNQDAAQAPSVDFSSIATVSLASWQPIDEASVKEDLIPEYHEVVKDRALIKMNLDLWSKQVGDTIQFPIPQRDEVLTGTVNSVEPNQLQTRTLQGKVQDGSKEYPFVITLGVKRSFVHLSSATGTYEVVGDREYAWLMPSGNMNTSVDYSLPDTFMIDPDPRERSLEPE